MLSFKSPFVTPMGKEAEADEAKRRLGDGLVSDHLLAAKVRSPGSKSGKYAIVIGGKILPRSGCTLQTLTKMTVNLSKLSHIVSEPNFCKKEANISQHLR